VLTGLSYKTIERAADRGEPVGRLRVGRKVLYMRASLAKWLASKATTPTEIGA
jgi:phage terminase Nu1 subunit (DNA packaging protein)